jgi:hypothetical protein
LFWDLFVESDFYKKYYSYVRDHQEDLNPILAIIHHYYIDDYQFTPISPINELDLKEYRPSKDPFIYEKFLDLFVTYFKISELGVSHTSLYYLQEALDQMIKNNISINSEMKKILINLQNTMKTAKEESDYRVDRLKSFYGEDSEEADRWIYTLGGDLERVNSLLYELIELAN